MVCINTDIRHLNSTQDFQKNMARSISMASMPGKMKFVTAQNGEKYTIVDEGWQVTPCTILGASIS